MCVVPCVSLLCVCRVYIYEWVMCELTELGRPIANSLVFIMIFRSTQGPIRMADMYAGQLMNRGWPAILCTMTTPILH